MLDRFNIGVVWLDHARSLVKYPSGKPDGLARATLWGLPTVGVVLVGVTQYRLANPVALTPVAGLMAGIFFASVGQLISIRARVADSVQLSASKRLRSHLRESVSGMLLAAVGCMVLSLLLGVLSLIPAQSDLPKAPALEPHWYWVGVGLTALIVGAVIYVVLLFLSSARRVYASYLEAFEGGLPLGRRAPGELPDAGSSAQVTPSRRDSAEI